MGDCQIYLTKHVCCCPAHLSTSCKKVQPSNMKQVFRSHLMSRSRSSRQRSLLVKAPRMHSKSVQYYTPAKSLWICVHPELWRIQCHNFPCTSTTILGPPLAKMKVFHAGLSESFGSRHLPLLHTCAEFVLLER
jgi:hypothetical protein